MTATDKMTTTDHTIDALLNQIAADCARCATVAFEAAAAMAEGKRNQAIGTLLGIEVELERLAGLKVAVLALHRSHQA